MRGDVRGAHDVEAGFVHAATLAVFVGGGEDGAPKSRRPRFQAGGDSADLRPNSQRMPPPTIIAIRMPFPTPVPQLSTQLTRMNSMLIRCNTKDPAPMRTRKPPKPCMCFPSS